MGRRRLIRKQPLIDKIRNYPFDVFLSINEARLSIDWDDYIPQTLAIGTGLDWIFTILCKLRNHNIVANARRDNSVFRTDGHTYRNVVSRAIYGNDGVEYSVPHEQKPTHYLAWILTSMLVTIFLASVINATNVLWFPYRSYTLLNTSTSYAKPKGSNVVKQNVSFSPEKGLVGRFLAYFGERSFYETESDSELDTTYEVAPVNKEVWVLKVWDPSPFQLYLFATFSPLLLFTTWLLSTEVALWKTLAVVALHNCLSFWLTSKFLLLISDKQIIYQETFNEYNRKYVIPKTSVLKKNAIVDATYGPSASARMTVHDDEVGHLQNDNAFVTHDINGRQIKSVRGDKIASRATTPMRESLRYLDVLSTGRSRYGSIAELRERPSYIDDTDSQHLGWITLSTPYLPRTGNESFQRTNDTFTRDTFTRPTSRPVSPSKTPSRYAYNTSFSQRTQLSPSRNYSSRPGSPNRSPSPNKRRWQ